jgi:hypothetical protein
MRIKSVLPLVVTLAFSIWPSAQAGETPKPANGQAATDAEAQAKAAYEAAEKAAREAGAAIAPFRAALQKADAAFASATRIANAKRQQATDSKAMAGEAGEKELQQAEANVPLAVKALAEATEGKPAAEKAFEDAKAAAAPLQQAYEVADKALKEAEAVARAAVNAVNRLGDEARDAATRAAVNRRTLENATLALAQARRNEPVAAAQAETAAQNLAQAEAQKRAADEALGKARKLAAAKGGNRTAIPNAQRQVVAAAQRLAKATADKNAADALLATVKEQIASGVEAVAAGEKAVPESARLAEAKRILAEQAAAKRKAIANAEAVVEQARQNEKQARLPVNAAAKAVAAALPPKTQADAALAIARKKTAGAAAAVAVAEKAAQETAANAKQISADATRSDAQKKRAAADAAAKRKSLDSAKAALAQTRQREQAVQARATSAAQRLAAALAQKKAADEGLATASSQVAAASDAWQALREAAKDLAELDEAAKAAAVEVAAKRGEAAKARAALAPVERKLEQAAFQAAGSVQKITQAEARVKSSEEALENLKKKIAAAKQGYLADEEAAKAAEAAAAPLKAEAEKNQAAYAAAVKMADDKVALAEQAETNLYRLIDARQVPDILESPIPPKPANRIDEIVFAKLGALGIKPVLCSDAVFIRRAYLDLTGTLPSADEAKEFIQSPDANKRVDLVDRLLEHSAHVDYWAMKWCDILKVKAEFPVKVWPNAAQAYHRWVWESLAQNKRYDQFVRELLTSSGSNFRVGPVNFYRAIQDRTPEGIAAAVGLALMGTRTHAWPQDRRAGMAAFFSQVGYKPTSEWKEEVVFWDPLKSAALPSSTASGIDAVAKAVTATNQIPGTLEQPLDPNPPLAVVFPDGVQATIPPDRDPREAFADWLIRPGNPWFARAIVNRTWAWVMGRGIIHEPDDIRDDNPPGNPELLAYLEKELVAGRFDLKRLKRLIFTSNTYQFSSIPRFKGPEARANFASYLLRRVEAEVLIDAVNNITGTSDLYTSAVPEPFSYIPNDMTAVELADGSVTSAFLTLFGRSSRSTGMEAERINELASPQWLHMLNSATIQNKLQNGPKLRNLLSSGGKPGEIAERLYLTILSRLPTEDDLAAVQDYSKSGASKGRDAWIDLAWTLVNSPEFLLRH